MSRQPQILPVIESPRSPDAGDATAAAPSSGPNMMRRSFPPSVQPAAGPGPKSPAALLGDRPDERTLRHLVASGLSDTEIGALYGKTHGAVHYWRKAFGIPSLWDAGAHRPKQQMNTLAPEELRERRNGLRSVAPTIKVPTTTPEGMAVVGRYQDVSEEELAREKAREAAEHRRRPRVRNVTAAFCGDPPPHRRLA